jgi:hypothetical protein
MGSKKTTAKKAAKKAVKPAKKAARKPFTTERSQAAYEHFLPLAKKVPTDGLDVCRADLAIARVNIDAGIAAITPRLAEVKKKLPRCPIQDVLELPALILATSFSTTKIVALASNREIEQRLAAMRPMREAALKQLEVFALLGTIPAGVPAGIRKGSGSLDNAEDAIAIPGVFHDYHADIDGKHPFTPAMLKKLGEEGDWLGKHLKPWGAKEAPAERDPASIVRDQLWAMVALRHEHLRQAGAVVFGTKDLDAHVPPLGARVASTSKGATEKANGQGATEAAAPQPEGGTA